MPAKLNWYNTIRNARDGQVLVETMVALSITVIGLLGILAVLSSAIGVNRVITQQYTAAYLASEGIEAVKYQLDVNAYNGDPFTKNLVLTYYEAAYDPGSGKVVLTQLPASGWSGVPSSFDVIRFDGAQFLTFQNSSVPYFYGYDANGSLTPFKRVIVVRPQSNADEVVVDSVVAWQARGGSVSGVTVEDYFFNWRKQP